MKLAINQITLQYLFISIYDIANYDIKYWLIKSFKLAQNYEHTLNGIEIDSPIDVLKTEGKKN